MLLRSFLFLLLFFHAATIHAGEVREIVGQRLTDSTSLAVRGVVELPSGGNWFVQDAMDSGTRLPIRQAYLLPPENYGPVTEGRRMQAYNWQRRIDAGRGLVASVYWPCVRFAQDNEGRGPDSWAELGENGKHARSRIANAPRQWKIKTAVESDGPFAKLLKANFAFSNPGQPNDRSVLGAKREPLAVEIRPYVGDGKHWIQYTDGSVERVEIDSELVKKHDLVIRPIVEKRVAFDERPPAVPYKLFVVAATESPIQCTLRDAISGDVQSVTIAVDGIATADDVLTELDKARELTWSAYAAAGQTAILNSWASLEGRREQRNNNRRVVRNDLNMFSVLGGRAAIDETLQLQNLVVTKTDEERTVDIDSIPGVKVAGHPYEKMLAGKAGGQLKMANLARHDRFFLYVPQPAYVLPMIESGGQFMNSITGGFSANTLDYGLQEKYLVRLGMSRKVLESAIKSGFLKELTVTSPDLFFVDGTDLTVVARLDQPKVFSTLLSALNIKGLGDGQVAEIETQYGTAYWTLRGDLLCVSSLRSELDSVVELMNSDGEGSLGKSPEFRYMLTKLPVNDDTRAFAYFSDPFIRRLVGPKVKIAQFRRMRARQKMEYLTAQSIKARMDGRSSPTDIGTLAKQLPDISTDGYQIQTDGAVVSSKYARLDRMRSIEEVPVEKATPAEVEAYRQYNENYERFWRQFFDPIAIRLSDGADSSLQLETFILPLIDSSIYNGLRDVMHAHKDNKRMQVPVLQPTPVLQFSANLNDKAWQNSVQGFADFFERYSGASSAILDDLGPSAHLAVFDADPVIALGSGDLMGAMGGGGALRVGRGAEMFMVPAALSVLTRPCTILVETQNPEQTARYLRQSALRGQGRGDNDFRTSFYQRGDRDSWVWASNILGMVNLRFGIEISGQYLVIRNIPWSEKDRIAGVVESPMDSARLSVSPAACKLQLPGLFASASDQERKATMRGLGRLYPLVLSGVAEPENAATVHQRLFGFRPVHPRGGKWKWENNQLVSSVYGSVHQQRQPMFELEKPFGLMHALSDVNLSMQFEEDGLRSRITWKFRNEELAEK